MTDDVECQVCGEQVGRRGIGKHAGMHRREFTEAVGRPPEGYDEVREWAEGRLEDAGTTLAEWGDT